MDIELDPQSPVPIYQQLHDRIVEAMAAGDLEPGHALASVRHVALAFGINVATVGKAYDALRRQDLIVTNRKSGSVIAREPGMGTEPAFLADWTARLTTLLAEAVAHGMPDADVLGYCQHTIDSFAERRRRATEAHTRRTTTDTPSRGGKP